MNEGSDFTLNDNANLLDNFRCFSKGKDRSICNFC